MTSNNIEIFVNKKLDEFSCHQLLYDDASFKRFYVGKMIYYRVDDAPG